MAMAPQKRQKKLERRKAKTNAKRQAAVQRDARDLTSRIERSATAQILHCCTTNILWQQGMSNVLFSRELNSGSVAFVAFLVDMYCLGVKDVTFDVVSRSRYDWQVYSKLLRGYEIVNLDPRAARKLVEGAVEYAGQLGLSPHRDYLKSMRIFGDVDARSYGKEFTYGKDGKPFFVAGPRDSPGRCNQIMNLLTERCGPEGFHYLMPLSGSATLPADAKVFAIDDSSDVKEDSH